MKPVLASQVDRLGIVDRFRIAGKWERLRGFVAADGPVAPPDLVERVGSELVSNCLGGLPQLPDRQNRHEDA